MNLGKNTKITRVIDATAAGTSDINGSTIDMQGFEGVLFTVGFDTITASAVTSIKVQQGDESDASDMSDLEGTGVTVADTDDTSVAWIDLFRPAKRYVRVVVDRGTQNAVVDFGLAQQYGPRKMPTTHDATTVLGGEFHASPAEGTA